MLSGISLQISHPWTIKLIPNFYAQRHSLKRFLGLQHFPIPRHPHCLHGLYLLVEFTQKRETLLCQKKLNKVSKTKD